MVIKTAYKYSIASSVSKLLNIKLAMEKHLFVLHFENEVL